MNQLNRRIGLYLCLLFALFYTAARCSSFRNVNGQTISSDSTGPSNNSVAQQGRDTKTTMTNSQLLNQIRTKIEQNNRLVQRLLQESAENCPLLQALNPTVKQAFDTFVERREIWEEVRKSWSYPCYRLAEKIFWYTGEYSPIHWWNATANLQYVFNSEREKMIEKLLEENTRLSERLLLHQQTEEELSNTGVNDSQRQASENPKGESLLQGLNTVESNSKEASLNKLIEDESNPQPKNDAALADLKATDTERLHTSNPRQENNQNKKSTTLGDKSPLQQNTNLSQSKSPLQQNTNLSQSKSKDDDPTKTASKDFSSTNQAQPEQFNESTVETDHNQTYRQPSWFHSSNANHLHPEGRFESNNQDKSVITSLRYVLFIATPIFISILLVTVLFTTMFRFNKDRIEKTLIF